jgi:hypothetical protein
MREVAVLAIGDALVCKDIADEPALWELWRRSFPDHVARDRLAWRVRTYVY